MEPARQQSLLAMFWAALIHSVHRPAAVFLPVIAWTLSFRAFAMFLEARSFDEKENKQSTCGHVLLFLLRLQVWSLSSNTGYISKDSNGSCCFLLISATNGAQQAC